MEETVNDCIQPIFSKTNPRIVVEDNKRIYAAAHDLLEALEYEIRNMRHHGISPSEATLSIISKARGQS